MFSEAYNTMKGVIKSGRPGSLIKAKSRGRTIDVRKPSGSASDWDKHIQTGIEYKAPTAVYRKDLGKYVSSTGYAFDMKPEGFKFLGEKGSKFGIQRAGATRMPNTIGGSKGLPKPATFKSFSEYFAKEELGGNLDAYNIGKSDKGIITSITAKPQDYRSFYRKSGKKKKQQYSSYVPREVVFTPEGRIVSDIQRGTYTKDYDSDEGGYRTEKDVYVKAEKLYDNGTITKEVLRDTYDSLSEKKGKDRREQEKVYDSMTKFYEGGKLAKAIKMDNYKAYDERSSSGRETEEKPYIEEEIYFDTKTGDVVSQKVYDTYIDKYRSTSSGKQKEYYEPFLEKLYDYKGGKLYEYSPEAPDVSIYKPPKAQPYVIGADGKKYPVAKGSTWKPAGGGTYVGEKILYEGNLYNKDYTDFDTRGLVGVTDIKAQPKVEIKQPEKLYFPSVFNKQPTNTTKQTSRPTSWTNALYGFSQR